MKSYHENTVEDDEGEKIRGRFEFDVGVDSSSISCFIPHRHHTQINTKYTSTTICHSSSMRVWEQQQSTTIMREET